MRRFVSFVMALGLTSVLVSMAAAAGWQRGGLEAEQFIWLAISCVLTVAVHLLPAVTKKRTFITTLVWVAGFMVCVWSHAQFFLFSDQHASEARVEKVVPTTAERNGRSTASISAQISKATANLVWMKGERRDAQASLIASLRQELDVARAEENIAVSARNIAAADPVSTRVASVAGISTDTVSTIVSLVTAVSLELFAVLFWAGALERTDSQATYNSSFDENAASAGATDAILPEVFSGPVHLSLVKTEPVEDEDPVSQVRQAVARNEIRPTVIQIRNFLHCSQATALRVRRAVLGEQGQAA